MCWHVQAIDIAQHDRFQRSRQKQDASQGRQHAQQAPHDSRVLAPHYSLPPTGNGTHESQAPSRVLGQAGGGVGGEGSRHEGCPVRRQHARLACVEAGSPVGGQERAPHTREPHTNTSLCRGSCGEEESRHTADATAAEATAPHAAVPHARLDQEADARLDRQPREPSHLHITIAKALKKRTYHALFVAQSLLDMVQKEKQGGKGGAEESDADGTPRDALALDGVAVAEMMVTLVAEWLRELFAAHLLWSIPHPSPSSLKLKARPPSPPSD